NPTSSLNVATAGAGQDATRIEVDRSTDGGVNWKSTFLGGGTGTQYSDGYDASSKRLDPVVKFAADGVLFVAYGVQQGDWTTDGKFGPTLSKTHTWLVLAVSHDGGATFDKHVTVADAPGVDDKNGDTGVSDSTPLKTALGIESWQLATGPDGKDHQDGKVH